MSKGEFVKFSVTPSVRLNKRQAILYAFVLDKYNSKKTITLPEVVKQYTENGCQKHFDDGTPAYYVYNWKEHTEELKPLKGDDLRRYALMWFTHNLGVFIVKGLLTVMPAMELSQLMIEEVA